MSFTDGKWQTTRSNIRERTKAMFNNELLSDVHLIVRKSPEPCSENETSSTSHDKAGKYGKMLIAAHKFVLAISSPVFFDMFYGETPEKSSTIELRDCEYESLLEVLRYVYSDDVNLTRSNVIEVLHLAEHYEVTSLVEKCIEYLGKNITPSNVIGILIQARNYQLESVVAGRCWEVIDKYTEQIVKSNEFATIDNVLLEALVSRESLTVNEVELFEAVNCWANKQCEIQGFVQNGNLKRKMLGEEVVKKIRFPVMRQDEFAKVVLESNILYPEECYDLMKHFSSVLSSPLGFLKTKRVGWHRETLCRFDCVVDYGWFYGPGKHDSIIFAVDKSIILHGMRFCGYQNEKYSLNLKISNTSSTLGIVSLKRCFSSQKLPHKSSHYWGFEVLFDLPVIIEKGVRYCVDAVISGMFSWRGQGGVSSPQCSGVCFNFENSDQSNNGTSVTKGQFPEFLFCKN